MIETISKQFFECAFIRSWPAHWWPYVSISLNECSHHNTIIRSKWYSMNSHTTHFFNIFTNPSIDSESSRNRVKNSLLHLNQILGLILFRFSLRFSSLFSIITISTKSWSMSNDSLHTLSDSLHGSSTDSPFVIKDIHTIIN